MNSINLINEEIKYVECPMNWDLTALRKLVKVDRIVEKLQERLEENTEGETWNMLNILFFLSFELYMAQKFSYRSLLCQSEEIINSDPWLQKYHCAAEHVLYSMFACSILKTNSKRAVSYYEKIKSYKEMTNEEKAFLLATKACFHMMYGSPGNSAALKIFSEVLVLNENEPEWWFLKGKCLARMRRLHYRSRPTDEELSSFRKAVQLEDKCSRYLIHLARSGADLGSHIKHNKTSVDDFKVLHALHAEVESLLRKAVKLKVASAHLICHIAKSFMKLPYYFQVRNHSLTQFCVLQAMTKSPTDPMVNHTFGLYCLMQNEVESAFYYLTEASNMGVYGASFDLCRLKWREDCKYDPVPDLTAMLEKNDQYGCSEIHGLLATYYFFAKNDLLSAIDHWKKWEYSRAKNSYLITSMFLGQESFDFSSALYDEVRLEYHSTRYSNLQDRLQLDEVLKIIKENQPELQLENPRRQRQYLIDKAQMISKIGRAFPDSIVFMHKEQRAIKMGKTLGKKEVGKSVSSKYNAYRREKKVDKNADDRKREARSQSASRAQEYVRKPFEKPFFRPPKRHRSVEFLNNGGNPSSGRNESKNTTSSERKKSEDTTSSERKNSGNTTRSERKKEVGSGRMHSNDPNSYLQMKAASLESLLLDMSYKSKERFRQNERYKNSSSFNRRSSSQESLLPNRSTGRQVPEKQALRNTQMNSLKAESSGKENYNQRYASSREVSRDKNGVRQVRQPSICEDAQTSTESRGADTRGNWRKNEERGTDLTTPQSRFFQLWQNREQRDDSSSCASSVSGESSRNKERSNDSRSSPRSTSRDGGNPTATLIQPRNRLDQGDRLGPSLHSEHGQTARSFSRFSSQGRDAPTSSYFQSFSHTKDQGDRLRPSRGDSPTASNSESWRHLDQSDRGESSSRASSAKEDQWRNDKRQSGNSISSSRSSAVQQDFQLRPDGKAGYNPRGGSFSRGKQHGRSRDVGFRGAKNGFYDSLGRLELSKK